MLGRQSHILGLAEQDPGPGPPEGGNGPAASPLSPLAARRRHAIAVAVIGGHALSLVAAAALILRFNRNQWFFGDEWAFFATRMTGWGRGLFAPHNEHWLTVPVLIYRGLYATFGLRTYVPYVVVLLLLHLTATHLLWRVMTRAGVAPLISTALAGVFALLGAGGENLLWAFQIGFVGSVALGLLHILLIDHRAPFGRRDRAAWAVAVIGLMFSGMSVTMIATSGIVVLLRRGPKDAVKTVAVPAAVYLMWLIVIGHEGLNSHDRSLGTLLDAPEYVWVGLSSALERSTGIPGAGAALVLAIIVWVFRQRVLPAASTPMAMAIGAFGLFVIAAAGRSGFGFEQAKAGRYAYVCVALVLPVLGLMLSEITGRQASRELGAVGLVSLALLHNVGELRTQSGGEAARELQIRGQILASAELVDQGAQLVDLQPEPAFSPNVTVDSLRRFREEGTLPRDVEIQEKDRLAAATQLQVALTDTPPPSSMRTPPEIFSAGAVVNDEGCLLIGPTGLSAADLRFSQPQAISLRSPTGGEVIVTLHSSAEPGVMGPARTFLLRPVAQQWLLVSRSTVVTLSVPGSGATEMCGVRTK